MSKKPAPEPDRDRERPDHDVPAEPDYPAPARARRSRSPSRRSPNRRRSARTDAPELTTGRAGVRRVPGRIAARSAVAAWGVLPRSPGPSQNPMMTPGLLLVFAVLVLLLVGRGVRR